MTRAPIVKVGNWLPRASILPLWIPTLVKAFWEQVPLPHIRNISDSPCRYLTMATLSLYFFNLLPIPHLDGSELLQSFVDLTFDNQRDMFMYDVEALESSEGHYEVSRKSRRRKAWIIRCFHIVTTVLVISCILFTILNSLIS